MKSPFPGMDPYLEKYWHEVHHRLVIYTGDVLQANLPPPCGQGSSSGLSWRRSPTIGGLSIRTFMSSSFRGHPFPAAASETTVHIEEEPVLITPQTEPLTEGYIEIVDAESGNRVITVIEFLSPTNKSPGWGREEYAKKQGEVIRSGANLVEIDLNRSGQRTFALEVPGIPVKCRTTYQICVWRSNPPGRFEVYRAPLTRRLPSIRIPLRASDADVRLDLQTLVDRCYANGRYDDLDYRADPNPPLDASDAAMADELLRAKGLR